VSNTNKNKPFTSEELFQLLDKQSDAVTHFNEMDDFEKEALEGFKENVSVERAKILTAEVNTAISEKVSATKGTQTNKIIWFSAAASIVLIIGVSIFFFNKTKDDSKSLALNEISKPEVSTQDMSAPQKVNSESEIQVETKSANSGVSSISQNQVQLPSQKKTMELTVSGPGASHQVSAESEAAYGGAIQDSKDVSKVADEVAVQNGAIDIAYKLESKKKEQVTREESENDNKAAKNATASTTLNKKANALSKADDADMDKLAEEKPSKINEKETIGYANTNASSKPSSSPTVVSAEMSSNIAYYNGGEFAIKEFVVSYFNTKQLNSSIIGKYKVKGIVDLKGNLKVTSIEMMSNEDVDFIENIKKALNSMSKWNPASVGGKKSSSTVEFIIGF
jgi:hypothetical protein